MNMNKLPRLHLLFGTRSFALGVPTSSAAAIGS